MSSLSISPQVSTHLLEQWSQVRDFSAQVCHIQAPVGTGSKHVINHFQREIAGECLTWHIRLRENLYGWEILPVLVNGLWKTIRHSSNMVAMVRKSLELDLGDDRLNDILRGMSESLQHRQSDFGFGSDGESHNARGSTTDCGGECSVLSQSHSTCVFIGGTSRRAENSYNGCVAQHGVE